jgi:hypothetical protein
MTPRVKTFFGFFAYPIGKRGAVMLRNYYRYRRQGWVTLDLVLLRSAAA